MTALLFSDGRQAEVVELSCPECGYTVFLESRWLDQYDYPDCPECICCRLEEPYWDLEERARAAIRGRRF